MTSLEKAKASNAWDATHNLPLCPGANNPWIYCAYMVELLRLQGDVREEESQEIGYALMDYAVACAVQGPEGPIPGLFNRWPNNQGGSMSHDELTGIARLVWGGADGLLKYLSKNGWVYANLPEDRALGFFARQKFSMLRPPILPPYIQARAAGKLGFIGQTVAASVYTFDALTTKAGDMRDAGGRLRLWVMAREFEDYPVTRRAVQFWRKKMAEKGFTPRNCFAVEPKEYPIFAELAPETF